MIWLQRMILSLAVLLTPLCAAHAEWVEATTPHFVIVSGGSAADTSRFAQRLEAVHWLMTQATGVAAREDSTRVRIYLVDSVDDVHRAIGIGGGQPHRRLLSLDHRGCDRRGAA